MKLLNTALFLGIAAIAVTILGGTDKLTCTPVPPEEPVCVVAQDCEGLPHVMCAGEWTCQFGQCSWKCTQSCVPSPEVCGDGLDNDCNGLVDEGCCISDSDCGKGFVCQVKGPCPACDCPPGTECPECDCWGTCVPYNQNPSCYSDKDCAAGEYCQITNDCCAPQGCIPGQPCPDVCVACGQCVQGPGPGCCFSDADCAKGTVCVSGVCEEAAPEGMCWSSKDCLEGGKCVGAITCPCGALCFAASTPGKCVYESDMKCKTDSECPEGYQCEMQTVCPDCVYQDPPCLAPCWLEGYCVLMKNEKCYGDEDCAAGDVCNITNDCCPPKGCEPGMICPTVCVPCGECLPKGDECSNDADCKPGYACTEQVICPDCVYEDPPCKVACKVVHTCQPMCKTLNPYGYGMCEMIIGIGFDGKQCTYFSGCGCGEDCAFFFKTVEECQKACMPQNSCATIDPTSYGDCKMLIGYGFDGKQCVSVGGCGCGDCVGIFKTLEECKKACF